MATGGTTPAIMWGQFMANALANTPASDFCFLLAHNQLSPKVIITLQKHSPKKEAAKDEKADKKNDKGQAKDGTVKDDSGSSKEEELVNKI